MEENIDTKRDKVFFNRPLEMIEFELNVILLRFLYRIIAPLNNMRTLEVNAQPINGSFSTVNPKYSVAPPSFRLCCLSCA